MGGKDLVIDTVIAQWGSVPQCIGGRKDTWRFCKSHLMEVVTGQVGSVWRGNGCVY